MNQSNVLEILRNHLPPASIEYCFSLWMSCPFELKLSKSRQTKVGDFTSKRSRKHPRITLNNDLNPFLFLTTYIHEVAHLQVFLRHADQVDPHGEEWKQTFTNLLIPLLWENVYPQEILHKLRRHMINPKASSFADTKLTEAFRLYDTDRTHAAILSQLPEGSIFQLQGKYFKKGKLRRTRVLCKELKSKRDYLVPADALVKDVQLSLL
jgi:SprT protein